MKWEMVEGVGKGVKEKRLELAAEAWAQLAESR